MNGAQARTGRPASAGSAIEGMLLSLLANRYLWLALGLAAYIIIHLTLLQYRPRPWFETEDLLAHSMFIIELALLATVLLCGLGAGQALSRYTERRAGPVRRWHSIAAQVLTLVLCALALLLPLMLANNNPQLAEQGLKFPLTILQRGMLLLLLALCSLNVLNIARLFLRLPALTAIIATVLFHSGLALLLTMLSTRVSAFQRLNDVFYYNQLHRYSESLPDFQLVDEKLGSIVFHNIQMPWFGYYLSFAVFLWLAGLMIWLARGSDVLLDGGALPAAPEKAEE